MANDQHLIGVGGQRVCDCLGEFGHARLLRRGIGTMCLRGKGVVMHQIPREQMVAPLTPAQKPDDPSQPRQPRKHQKDHVPWPGNGGVG